MALQFTIAEGPPRTKKNSSRLVTVRAGFAGTRQKIIPSKAYEEWNASAQLQMARFRAQYKRAWEGFLPLPFPVNCKALFYRHADVGDAVGFYQALADSLQEGRILVNDKQIVSWDGSRMLVDSKNPRVEITITTAEE